MSERSSSPHGKDIEGGARIPRTYTAVTLSPEQFESLYLQPKSAAGVNTLAARFGNPTALGTTSFLLAQWPLAMELLGFHGSSTASALSTIGAFYTLGGVGLYIAAILEIVIGNTFPAVVFGTFGGFFISYAVLLSPSLGIFASFAPAADAANPIAAAAAGMENPLLNNGIAMYFVVWAIFTALYAVVALRTNVPFVMLFTALTCVFATLASAYFHLAVGAVHTALHEVKIAGGFSLVVSLCGFYIDVHLLLASVDFPVNVPIFDISHIIRGRSEKLKAKTA